MAWAIFLAAFLLLALVFLSQSVKIIRPYQKGLIERLGRYMKTIEPGLRFLIPFADRLVRVDMRESVVDVPPQEVITADNVVVAVDAVVYYEATAPERLVYNVSNFILAVIKLAQTNLRNVVGDMQLDDALTSRDTINTRLREILDDATDKWGTRVVRVEIQRIDPPPDVMAAMHGQMKAERNRRAVVTEAQGAREAAITRAEGEKAAAILSAEGSKQGAILTAEGEKAAAILSAEGQKEAQALEALGQAAAIRAVYQAIHDGGPTADLIAVKYLETLSALADGQATKIIVPAESSALLGALAGMRELLSGTASPDGSSPPPPAPPTSPSSPPS